MSIQEMVDDQIDIAEAPSIPGLTFRRFRGDSDFPKMAAVINSSAEADGIERVDTVEEVRKNYGRLVNSDPAADMVFAEIGGEVVGYSRVFWYQEEATKNRL